MGLGPHQKQTTECHRNGEIAREWGIYREKNKLAESTEKVRYGGASIRGWVCVQ